MLTPSPDTPVLCTLWFMGYGSGPQRLASPAEARPCRFPEGKTFPGPAARAIMMASGRSALLSWLPIVFRIRVRTVCQQFVSVRQTVATTKCAVRRFTLRNGFVASGRREEVLTRRARSFVVWACIRCAKALDARTGANAGSGGPPLLWCWATFALEIAGFVALPRVLQRRWTTRSLGM